MQITSRSLTLLLVPVAMTSTCPATSNPTGSLAAYRTWERIRQIKTAMSCAPVPECLNVRLSNLDTVNDGWEREIAVKLLEDEYEVRSAGADGTMNTRDDLVFQPSRVSRLAASVAGCYKFDKRWWNDLADNALRLDTSHVAGDYLRVVPDVGLRTAGWQVHLPDSVIISWMSYHSSVWAHMRFHSDTLTGRAQVYGRDVRKVQAIRTICAT